MRSLLLIPLLLLQLLARETQSAAVTLSGFTSGRTVVVGSGAALRLQWSSTAVELSGSSTVALYLLVCPVDAADISTCRNTLVSSMATNSGYYTWSSSAIERAVTTAGAEHARLAVAKSSTSYLLSDAFSLGLIQLSFLSGQPTPRAGTSLLLSLRSVGFGGRGTLTLELRRRLGSLSTAYTGEGTLASGINIASVGTSVNVPACKDARSNYFVAARWSEGGGAVFESPNFYLAAATSEVAAAAGCGGGIEDEDDDSWVDEEFVLVALLCGGGVVAALLLALCLRLRRNRNDQSGDEEQQKQKPPTQMSVELTVRDEVGDVESQQQQQVPQAPAARESKTTVAAAVPQSPPTYWEYYLAEDNCVAQYCCDLVTEEEHRVYDTYGVQNGYFYYTGSSSLEYHTKFPGLFTMLCCPTVYFGFAAAFERPEGIPGCALMLLLFILLFAAKIGQEDAKRAQQTALAAYKAASTEAQARHDDPRFTPQKAQCCGCEALTHWWNDDSTAGKISRKIWVVMIIFFVVFIGSIVLMFEYKVGT